MLNSGSRRTQKGRKHDNVEQFRKYSQHMCPQIGEQKEAAAELAQLRTELDTAKNSLTVSESVLFECRTDYNMVNCRNGELKAELDAKTKAVKEARDVIGKVANYNDNGYTVESLVNICWNYLTAHPEGKGE